MEEAVTQMRGLVRFDNQQADAILNELIARINADG